MSEDQPVQNNSGLLVTGFHNNINGHAFLQIVNVIGLHSKHSVFKNSVVGKTTEKFISYVHTE